MRYQIKACSISTLPRASSGQQDAYVTALPVRCDTNDVLEAALAHSAAFAEFGPTGHLVWVSVDGGEFARRGDTFADATDAFADALNAATRAGLVTEFNGVYRRVGA